MNGKMLRTYMRKSHFSSNKSHNDITTFVGFAEQETLFQRFFYRTNRLRTRVEHMACTAFCHLLLVCFDNQNKATQNGYPTGRKRCGFINPPVAGADFRAGKRVRSGEFLPFRTDSFRR